MSYFYIRELEFALRSKANRDTAEEILRVAMECRLPYALQRWWELSHEREGGAGSKNSVSRGKKKSPVKSSVGDATFLQGKEAVSYQHAEAYLGVSARWRQHLVKTGTLIASGKASRRQITTKSLFEYQPPLKAK